MLHYKGLVVLVTGASSGLGEAFAEQFAERGCTLILVARSEEKLQMLALRLQSKYGIDTVVLAADLAQPMEVNRLVSEIKGRGIRVDLLVNNAGAGIFERFLDAPLEEQQKEIALNVSSLVALSYAFLPDMVARRKGGVINLSSSAAFQPLPGANIYAATKSFVLLFSEALSQELDGTGVQVLAVCPGPVATAFFADKRPSIAQSKMDDPKQIVRESLRAFDLGKRVVIPGKWMVRMTAFGVRFLPRTMVARVAEKTAYQLNQR